MSPSHDLGDSPSSTASLALRFPHARVRTRSINSALLPLILRPFCLRYIFSSLLVSAFASFTCFIYHTLNLYCYQNFNSWVFHSAKLEIRKSQDLAKDFGETASKAEKEICKSKNCKLYIET